MKRPRRPDRAGRILGAGRCGRRLQLRGRISMSGCAMRSKASAAAVQQCSTAPCASMRPCLDGRTLRVIAALEALQGQSRGMVTVTPDLDSADQALWAIRWPWTMARGCRSVLGGGAATNWRRPGAWTRRDSPSGVECVDSLNAAMKVRDRVRRTTVIAGDPATTLERLAATMKDCRRIEVGGHTDAQLRGVQRRTRRRAQAIFEAMTQAGIDTRYTTAKGYGESTPDADNDSDAGREANLHRI